MKNCFGRAQGCNIDLFLKLFELKVSLILKHNHKSLLTFTNIFLSVIT